MVRSGECRSAIRGGIDRRGFLGAAALGGAALLGQRLRAYGGSASARERGSATRASSSASKPARWASRAVRARGVRKPNQETGYVEVERQRPIGHGIGDRGPCPSGLTNQSAAPLVVGENAITRHRDRLYWRHATWPDRHCDALDPSIDIALWDLKGKALESRSRRCSEARARGAVVRDFGPAS
jgi:hypothetical protein